MADYEVAERPSFWRRYRRWILFLGIPLLVIIVLVAILFSVCASWMFSTMAGAEACVEQFMVAGQAHDIDGAYALCAPGVISRSDLESFIEDYYADFYEHYEGIHTTGWHVETSGGQTTATLEGNISYTDGSTLPFDADLVKVGDDWKIADIYIGY